MLRRYLGDEVFFAGARDFLTAYAWSTATTEQFRDVMEAAAGEDLDWFFEQWIYAPSKPALVTWFQPYVAGSEDRVRVYVKQLQPHRLYRLHIDLSVHSGAETSFHANQLVAATDELTVLDLPSPGPATAVDVDPYGALLANIVENGLLERDDIPTVRVTANRRSGVGAVTATLTATSDEDLASYTLAWDLDGGSADSTVGESIIATFQNPGGQFDFWVSPRPGVTLVAGDESEIHYPRFEMRAYHAVEYGDRRYGDLNRDGVINGVDLSLLVAARGMTDDRATVAVSGDLDADGDIDDQDVTALMERFGDVLWEPEAR
jgi:hypothetical protein